MGVRKMIRGLWYRRKAILECKEKMKKESIARMLNPESMNRSDPGPMGNCQTPIRRKARGIYTSRG